MNVPIWPGSSSFSPGKTPFGFYDNDYQFQIDADKVAKFCAQRLGYPIMDVELQDINFYTAFEQAITIYGNELYAYKIKENYLSLEGAPSSSVLNNKLITPTLSRIIDISKQYGVEAGSGGNVPWYDGMIDLEQGVQEYDLNQWALSQSISSSIEIKRVFHEAPPSIIRYFDPYAGTGTQGLVDSFGFGNYSPGISFMMMPLNFDIAKLQAIEFNDQIRRSNYSFEIHNNKIKLFPIPDSSLSKLKIQYILTDERTAAAIQDTTNQITNVSNVPYNNPNYCQINPIGRSWIFEYTLAVCKEMLGYVRGKYSSIPIPNDAVSLNQADLITSSQQEKQALIENLRNYFEGTSRKSLLETRSQETEFRKKELAEVPFTIYIG